MKQPFPIFVISMECATQRRSHMSAQLERLGLEYTFFTAVDGRTADTTLSNAWIDDVQTTAIYGKPLTPGEKGCALSHILLWERIAGSGRNALVFEDDVVIPEGSLIQLLTPLLSELRQDRLILLGYLANSFWWRGKISLQGASYALRKPNHKTLSAFAYLITPRAAQQLVSFLKKNKLTHPVDWWYRPDGLGFTKIVDTWVTSRELIPHCYDLKSLIDATEGDRDQLKNLGRIGWLKRRLFLALRRVLFPAMRLVRSFWFPPIWPNPKNFQ